MDVSRLSLVELFPTQKRVYAYVFTKSDQFVKPWWHRELFVCESDRWMSVRLDGEEVARCKFTLRPGPLKHPVLGVLEHGQLDILAFEVATSRRGKGIGRATLQAIRERYPLPQITALNDGAHSRGFWDRLGWVRHEVDWGVGPIERVEYSMP